jgi:hypothetical protein
MHSNLTDKFGPCGLLCEKCFAYTNGPIKHSAQQLTEYLGAFDNYAKRFVTLIDEPGFAKYLEFKEVLTILSAGKCEGCRKQSCHLFSNCKVKQCYKDKNVEFCYQCDDFPCSNTGFDDNLEMRWTSINLKIKEIGLETYYNEIKDKPRY